MIFQPFRNDFLPSSKNILNGQHIIYPLKQKDICDYNPICLMSIGLMFYDKRMNLFRNKAVNWHVEVVDIYLKKKRTKKIICTEGHFNIFIGGKVLMKSLMLYAHNSILKKRQYLSNILKCNTQSYFIKGKISPLLD